MVFHMFEGDFLKIFSIIDLTFAKKMFPLVFVGDFFLKTYPQKLESFCIFLQVPIVMLHQKKISVRTEENMKMNNSLYLVK